MRVPARDGFVRILTVLALLCGCFIATASAGGELYWTEGEPPDSWPNPTGAGRVQRSTLDGLGVEEIASGLRSAGGIAVDPTAGKVYWADVEYMESGVIRRSNLDGSEAEDLIAGDAFGMWIALDPAGGKMYWTELESGRIRRANLDGSDPEDLVSYTDFPWGIALDLAGGKFYWAQLINSNVRRANLADGSDVEELLHPELPGTYGPGIALDLARGKLYWASQEFGLLGIADLDGTDRRLMFTGLDAPSGLAFDPVERKLYWAEGGAGLVRRASPDGSDVEDVLDRAPAAPIGIALVPDPSALDQCLAALSQAELERDEAIAELAMCRDDRDTLEDELFLARAALEEATQDSDADQVLDVADRCEGTPAATEVDLVGCSLAQFCRGIQVGERKGRAACWLADWGNDEPLGSPRDCRAVGALCQPL